MICHHAQRAHRVLSLALLCVALFLPATGHAQATENANLGVERLRMGFAKESIINVELGSIQPHLVYDAGLWLGYAHNPLVLMQKDADGNYTDMVGALVGRRMGGELFGAIALIDWLEIGVALPVVLYQSRGQIPPPEIATLGNLSAAGIGDLRIAPKVALLRSAYHFVDLAITPTITLPTGVPGDSYMGDGGINIIPEVAISRAIGSLRVAGNVGYRWRQEDQFLDLTIGPEVTYRAGASFDLRSMVGQPLLASAALSGAAPAGTPVEVNRSPLELLLGAAYDVTDDIQAFAGGGVGLIAGFGNPDFRFFAGIRYAPRLADRDGDGVPDARDQCPGKPEDFDAFDDKDGCPDNDNDQDGINDDDDRCPDEAENKDGIEDDDGCPEGQQARIGSGEIEIVEAIRFDSGKATIQARSYRVLKDVAQVLKENDDLKKVIIEGHTDNVGGSKYNLKLSQKRAEAVKAYLVKQGVDGARLEAKGFGDQKPIASNRSERGRARNRRVVFVISEAD